MDKKMAVKSFVKGVKANVICLQETKVEEMDMGFIQEICRGPYVDWMFLPAHGASGGILVCWDNRAVIREDLRSGVTRCLAFLNVLRMISYG